MYAHDWYPPHPPDHPDMHNRGEAVPYFEPDWLANHTDNQLPILSTIGRGPQGEGLYVDNVVNEDGKVSFGLYSTLTGELVWQSPNLAPPMISFKGTPEAEMQPGSPANLDITVKRGDETETYSALIPPGAMGSRIYQLERPLDRTRDDTYQANFDDLLLYGQAGWPSEPKPRQGDVVVFEYLGADEYGIVFGTIQQVDAEGNVVITARTFIPIPPVSIKNGHWFVGDQDTGVTAQGPKGDAGKPGAQGAKGERGEKGEKGDPGEDGHDAMVTVGTTVQLDPGSPAYVVDTDMSRYSANLEFGIPEGRPAKITEIEIHDLEPGEKATASIECTSSNQNTYKLSLALPRGEDGRSIDLQHGIWPLDSLPDYDDTELNTAFVVDDGDGHLDLYIKGRIAHDAEDGGPWTVVEDWGSWATYLDIDGRPFDWDDDGEYWFSDDQFKLWANIEDKPNLHDIATSGDYNDLENKPVFEPLTIADIDEVVDTEVAAPVRRIIPTGKGMRNG